MLSPGATGLGTGHTGGRGRVLAPRCVLRRGHEAWDLPPAGVTHAPKVVAGTQQGYTCGAS